VQKSLIPSPVRAHIMPPHRSSAPAAGKLAEAGATQRQIRGWRDLPVGFALGAAAALSILLVVAFFALVFQWNWLRGPAANLIGSTLHRQVTIGGDLHVRPWSWSPGATADDLTIANPRWAGTAPMARVSRLTLSVELPALLRGRLVLPLVSAGRPDIHLLRDGQGRANWNFSNSNTPASFKLPAIRRLVIDDGRLRIDDLQRKLVFSGTISSDEQATGAGRGVFRLDGQGALNAEPFEAHIVGGALLNVDPDRPYPFQARIRTGATHIAARGSLTHPFDLSRFTAQVRLSGENLGQLYQLTGLALPRTPPYDLTGNLAWVDKRVVLRGLGGRFGDSDLAGALSVDASSGRPVLTADLVSRRLKLADLFAVIGGGPMHAAGHTVSPEQVAVAAKLRAEHRILPDVDLQMGRLRAMDARVTYRAQSVESGRGPVRNLLMKVSLDHGLLRVDPLAATLRSGELTGSIRIDTRGATPSEAVDLKLSGARVEDLIDRGGVNPPLEGEFLARARLSGTGDSVRAAAASSNGALTLVIPHGEIRQSLAEFLGIDVANGAFLLLTKNERQAPVRCAVADFRAQNGVLTAQRIVLDTGVVLATGAGDVNLRDETLDLRLDGKPKKFRLLHIGGPITLKGRLSSPKVGVDLSKAAGQIGLAGLLGAVISPLALVLPFVDPGLAHNADCSSLLTEASRSGAPLAARPRPHSLERTVPVARAP
jgi:AsmA family protein